MVLVTRGFLVFSGMEGLQDQVGRMQELVVVWCGVVMALCSLSLISIQLSQWAGLFRKILVGGQPVYMCRDSRSHIVQVLWCGGGVEGVREVELGGSSGSCVVAL